MAREIAPGYFRTDMDPNDPRSIVKKRFETNTERDKAGRVIRKPPQVEKPDDTKEDQRGE